MAETATGDGVKGLVPIILAGGKGERFWPLSRTQRPKQFLCLDGSDRSLLQATSDRLGGMCGGPDRLLVVTASHLADGVRSQLPSLLEENLLVEPQGRDTAPAVAWASLLAAERYGPDAILGFFPADHWIADQQAFAATLRSAVAAARSQQAIVTLGITPNQPATGYGYIEQGDSVDEFEGAIAYKVNRFTEKPDRATAEKFLATGKFTWNSGMFVFPAGLVIEELRRHAPEILEPLEQKGVAAYDDLPKLSVDYALMEKTDRACVLPAAFGWDDLGDWNAVERLLKGDAANLVQGGHVGIDTQGCIIHTGDDQELVATVGLEDVVVVRDGNATLVVHKSRTQDIKALVSKLKEDQQYRDRL
ncbi:MAG: mannose-1-phosphate guanylyltransferase [Cyanobacteria bacterium P01_D01_bin.73]